MNSQQPRFDPYTGQPLPLPRPINSAVPYAPYNQAIAESEARIEARLQETLNEIKSMNTGQAQSFMHPISASQGINFTEVQSLEDVRKFCTGNMSFMSGEKLHFLNIKDGEAYVTWFDASIPKTVTKIAKFNDFVEGATIEPQAPATESVIPYIDERLNGLEALIMDIKEGLKKDESDFDTSSGVEKASRTGTRARRVDGRGNEGDAGAE